MWPLLNDFFPAGSDLGVLFQEQHWNEENKEKEEYIDQLTQIIRIKQSTKCFKTVVNSFQFFDIFGLADNVVRKGYFLITQQDFLLEISEDFVEP